MEAPKIRYVSATLPNSCVPACLAMITGKTLKQVISDIYEHWESTGRTEGITDEITDQFLAQSGYAVQRINYEYEPNKLLIDGWPINSFAPIHLVDVWSSNPAGLHCIVMNAMGKVYDPSNKKIKSMSEYQRIFSITGIWKVTDTLITITKE